MTYLGELISIGVAFSWTATAGQPWGQAVPMTMIVKLTIDKL